ncbi:hypothetical protein [Aliiglaciecola litoralis]|uniref:Uncharacterized protein n=1 Tax=Aliiglaciecola litoralis TaxID=582857 RepID=A0ABP3X762_9ALTE
MRLFIGFVFIVVSISLGYEIYTGDAFVKSGGGNINKEPTFFYFTITFEGVVWLSLLICLFLPEQKLKLLNNWLAKLDSKHDDNK